MTVWPVELKTWSDDGGIWFQSHQKMALEEQARDLACKVVTKLAKDCHYHRGLVGNFFGLLNFW